MTRSRRSIGGAATQRPWALPNYGQRQNTVGKHPTDRGVHVLGRPSARLWRGHPLAQPICLECRAKGIECTVDMMAETVRCITWLVMAFFEDKTGFSFLV